jgi:general secretion pathway protein J
VIHRSLPIKAAAGFTLVEVLVAMLIMAMMAGMAWKGVDGIVRTRDASQARLEQTMRLSTVLAQWEQDLASIQESSVVPQALSCDGAAVRLIRRTPSGLQVVVWSLQPDGSGSNSFSRWTSPAATTRAALQDSWLRSLQLQGDEAEGVRALSGLSQRQVYFFRDDNSWSNCQSSDAGQTLNPLPKGIRLVLTFAQAGGWGGDLTRDTVLRP